MAGITTDFRRRDSRFNYPLPKYGVMDLDRAFNFNFSGWDISEKLDGRTHELKIGSSVITGEMMADGRFFAFDLPKYLGRDIRKLPRTERLSNLDKFQLRRPSTPKPGETAVQFLTRILSKGGEGIVAAPLDAPFGYDVVKIKRCETFDCRVIAIHETRRSVNLELDGESCGWCAVTGPQFKMIQCGDIVEIAAFKRLSSGKFREPRFIRLRHDKN